MSVTTYSKIFLYTAYLIIAAAIGMVLFISYLLFSSPPVLDVKALPLPARPLQVHAGDLVYLQLDYCKHRDAPSKISIDFDGDYVVPSLSTVRNFASGCHVTELPFTMPLSSKPGTYKVLLTIEYRINALNHRSYEFYSQPIEVLQPEEEPAK
jgi:hypothetical protein